MSAITKENVVSFIENMSVLELSQLVKELETKFGVSAAAPVAAAAAVLALLPAQLLKLKLSSTLFWLSQAIRRLTSLRKSVQSPVWA